MAMWKDVPSKWRPASATILKEIYQAIVTAVTHPAHYSELAVRNRIKASIVVYRLFFRVPADRNSRKGSVSETIGSRLNQWLRGDLSSLVSDFEKDVAIVEASSGGREGLIERSNVDDMIFRLRRASELLAQGKYSKAKKVLLSLGAGDPTDERVQVQMKAKHPKRSGKEEAEWLELPDVADYAHLLKDDDFLLTEEEMEASLRLVDTDAACGLDGCYFTHLRVLLLEEALTPYTAFVNLKHQACLPMWYYVLHGSVRLAALNKMDPRDVSRDQMDYRPVGIGSAPRRMDTKAVFLKIGDAILEEIGRTQVAGRKGGGSALVVGLRAVLDANPDFCLVKFDVENAFNSVSRLRILQAICDSPSLRKFYPYFYCLLTAKSFVGVGAGFHVEQADFLSETGVQQGGVESGWLFKLVIAAAIMETNAELADHGGVILADEDDSLLACNPRFAKEAINSFQERLAKMDLELQETKFKIYAPSHVRNNKDYLELAASYKEGTLLDPNNSGQVFYGLECIGIPFGDEDFISQYLLNKQEKIIRDFQQIEDVFEEARHDLPFVPSRQTLWLFVLRCFQHYGSYTCRLTKPSLSLHFSRDLDSQILRLVGRATGFDMEEIQQNKLLYQRLRAPIRHRGMGVKSLEETRHAEYIGGVLEACMLLFERKTRPANDGGPPGLYSGMLENDAVDQLFGRGSFDYDNPAPFEMLLTHASSDISQGVREAFAGQTAVLESFVLPLGSNQQNHGLRPGLAVSLIGANAASAGVFPDCAVPYKKYTEEWNGTVGGLRSRWLRYQFANDGRSRRYEPTHLSYQNVDMFSAQALFTRTDSIGRLDDNVFRSHMSTYMGLPNAIFNNIEGFFIGHRSKVMEVDKYGHSVARHPSIPGAHQDKIHKDVQRGLAMIGRDAGLSAGLEAQNTFLGLISPDVYSAYLAAYTGVRILGSKDGIIPDVRFEEFPEVFDGTAVDEAPKKTAIVEVKQVHIGPGRYGRRRQNPVRPYGSSESDREVERRAEEVKKEYYKKAKGLDRRFADTQEGGSGPFETALSTFAYGGIIPCVFGAHGEVNREFSRVVQTLARIAAKKDTGLSLSLRPGLSEDARYSMVVSEYRRVLGLSFAKAMANIKLRRIQLIARTPQEATYLSYRNQVRNNFCRRTRDQPSWYTPAAIDQEAARAWYRFQQTRMLGDVR